MTYIKGQHIKALFDVQVDGNHRWDTDRVLEVDAYPVSLDLDGKYAADTTEPLASVKLPTLDYSDDCWYQLPDEWEAVRKLPEHVRKAVEDVITKALSTHLEIQRTQKYDRGATVFITEHRFPGEVEAHTVNGGYIVNMAGSGELGEFGPDELEDYDADLWHRP